VTTSHLIDHMPEVARSERDWTPDEAIHLGSCAACQAEWQMVGLALANRSPLPEVDADRIAQAVLRRLSVPPAATVPIETGRHRWWRPILGLAAAAAVVLVAMTQFRSRTDEPAVATSPVREATMLPELDELLQGEMELLLASMETDRTAEEPIGPLPRLGDLTDAELELLLKEVEG